MKKKLVFVGAGGFGREVIWQVSETNKATAEYDILGFIDNSPEMKNKTVNGYPVLGGSQWLIDYPDEICAVICVGDPRTREELYNEIKVNSKVSFPTVFASDVKCSDSVKFGQGCIICLSDIFTTNITVGDFVIVNLDCTVGHDSVIGDFVTVYPSVNISGNSHIDSYVEIGTGSVVIPHKHIGENTVVGAGAIVVKDLPPDCTAVGAPAAPIKFHKA